MRETVNIWWWFFVHKQPRRFIKRKMWRKEYFWQDSLFKHVNRIAGCRILGHRHVKEIGHEYGEPHMHCFNCGRRLEDTWKP